MKLIIIVGLEGSEEDMLRALTTSVSVLLGRQRRGSQQLPDIMRENLRSYGRRKQLLWRIPGGCLPGQMKPHQERSLGYESWQKESMAFLS